MAHYALLNYNNVVTKVVTGKDENSVDYNIELVYQDIYKQICKRTSYNTKKGIHYTNGLPSADQSKSFRKNFAKIGFTYDESRDAFIPPKPFDSWILNENSCLWEAPVEYPDDGNHYNWSESTQTWDLI